jgi:multidrug efflux pump subunit AcrA (membrane-fusion protein)
MLREARDGAARAEAERAMRLARRDLVRVPLHAPQAGVIVRRSAEPGAQVAEGSEVLALVPWNGMVFEARIMPEQIARVRAGQSARIRDPSAAPRDAVVDRVLPEADALDQTTGVWLRPSVLLPPPQLDRFGSASIVVGSAHRSVGLPDSAVVEDDVTGEKRIDVVSADSIAVWTTVVLGPGAAGWHELRAPRLAPGTRVVVAGQRGLPDSTRVRWE